MTVENLIKLLERLPKDAKIFRSGDEYNGDERSISKVIYRSKAALGVQANSVLIG